MTKPMGDLTKNFSMAEFACPCGKCDGGQMSTKFMEKLQKLRDFYGKPMPIESGYRCRKHNADVGGESASMHLQGRAADIVVGSSADRYQLQRYAFGLGFGGIAVNRTTVHVDDRDIAQARAWHYYGKKR